jgi:hypothetical protein
MAEYPAINITMTPNSGRADGSWMYSITFAAANPVEDTIHELGGLQNRVVDIFSVLSETPAERVRRVINAVTLDLIGLLSKEKEIAPVTRNMFARVMRMTDNVTPPRYLEF